MFNKINVLLVLLVILGLCSFIIYNFLLSNKDDTPSTQKEVPLVLDETSKETLVDTELKSNIIKIKKIHLPDEEAKKNNTLNENLPRPHFDDMVNENEQYLMFDSKNIDTLSLIETRELLFSLTDNMTENESQYILDELNGAAYITTKNKNVVLDATACSDKVCGLLISGYSIADVSNVLNDITSKSFFNNKLRGGSLRVFEEDGIYYGLMLGALGNKPLKIK